MHKSRIEDVLNKTRIGIITLLVLFFWIINPPLAMAENDNHKKINEKKSISSQSEETDNIQSFDRFQIELYGGILFLNPEDLNLFVSHDNEMQEFFYDSYFDYLVATNEIESWTRAEGEERQKLRRKVEELKALPIKYISSLSKEEHTTDVGISFITSSA